MSPLAVPSPPVAPGELLAAPARDLLGAAARVGQEAWWQERLFEVVGGWVASEVDLDAKLLFGAQRAHFAWRAQQWHDRLPRLRELDGERIVAAPSTGAQGLVDALGAAGETGVRLAGLYRLVLPRLVAAHRRHLGAASIVTDGPVVRTLTLLLPEELADLAAGEALLDARGAGVEAAATVDRLAVLLL